MQSESGRSDFRVYVGLSAPGLTSSAPAKVQQGHRTAALFYAQKVEEDRNFAPSVPRFRA